MDLLTDQYEAKERRKDMRAYRIVECLASKHPDPGDVFPSLRDLGNMEDDDEYALTNSWRDVQSTLGVRTGVLLEEK